MKSNQKKFSPRFFFFVFNFFSFASQTICKSTLRIQVIKAKDDSSWITSTFSFFHHISVLYRWKKSLMLGFLKGFCVVETFFSSFFLHFSSLHLKGKVEILLKNFFILFLLFLFFLWLEKKHLSFTTPFFSFLQPLQT